MALFSFGTDSPPKKPVAPISLLRGKSSAKLMNPYDKGAASSYAAQHLTVAGPKPVGPVDPNHLYAGTPPLRLNEALSSGGLSYSGGPAIPFTRTPAPATAPKSGVPIRTAQQPTGSTFASSSPDIQARLADMNRQTIANSSLSKTSPDVSPDTTVSEAAASAPKGSSIVSSLRAPVSEQKAKLDALRKGYISSLTMSPEERALNDQLAQFRGDVKQGVAGLEGQGRGIPLSLVRGQQEKLQTQGNLQEQTILERLQAAQQARQSQAQAAQAELGFTEQDIQAEQARQAAEAAASKPITLGGNLVQLNPATGQYETVYQAPTEAAKPVTLSAGQSLVDPTTGKTIATLPSAEPNAPATVQEYQFAQSQGFGGSFLDYQKAKEAAGTSGKPLSAESQKLQNIVNSGNQALDTIEQYVKDHPNAIGSLNIAERQIYDAARTNLTDAIGRLRSGGAISEDEGKRFLSMLPSPTDFDQSALYKISQLRTALGQAAGSGGGDEIDQFLDSFSGDLSRSVNGSIVNVNIGTKPVQVSDAIANNLAAADADFFQATGKHLQVNESVRSSDRQAQLYEAYKTGKGGRAAPPGHSFHEKGLAVDIGNWKEAEPYLRKYGFKNDLADDRNHFSIGEFA